MLETSLKLLQEITNHGYKAYIVGGFVRDYILGIKSNDIDIATNATPKDIKEIFDDSCLPSEDYGSVTVISKGIRFEITTFRRDIGYVNNRRPAEIKYIDDLLEDLKRRDFTINTICMDEDGEIVDLLDGRSDIEKRVIRCVGDANTKFSEDALRILRAIRFATILNFKLDNDTVKAIKNCKHLIRNLSYNRKKEELDKIFSSTYAKNGIKLLLELEIDKELDISNLDQVEVTNSLIDIWCKLDASDRYPFTASEREVMKSVKELIGKNNLDPYLLYKYGLYVNCIAGELNGYDIKDVTEKYNNLVIHRRKDINITSEEIMRLLNKSPGAYLRKIYDDIEQEILYCRLDNEKEKICKYILKKY